MEKYGIKSIGGGEWGKGFVDCLKAIDKRNIDLFKGSHILKRIEFAKERSLPYDWLINQLKHDWRKNIGTNEVKPNSSHK